jgi:hypothetical protein
MNAHLVSGFVFGAFGAGSASFNVLGRMQGLHPLWLLIIDSSLRRLSYARSALFAADNTSTIPSVKSSS